MKILENKTVSITLNQPINVRGNEIVNYKYENIILDDLKNYQITTLPNFHIISHQEKIKKIIELLGPVNHLKTLNDLKELNHSLNSKNIHPEVQFSLEAILFSKFFLVRPTYLSCKINELYSLKNHYYHVLKIKVTPSMDPQLLLKFENHIRFRLDGNRLFSKIELEIFIKKIPTELHGRIEYFEEPCENYLDSLEVLNAHRFELALDESLNELLTNKHILIDHKIKYVVLKPSLFGFINSLNLVEFFINNQISPIISSSYELNTGLNVLIYLADYSNRLIGRELFHGLDTMKFFPKDLFDAKIQEDQISLFY